MTQPFLLCDTDWVQVKDGDTSGMAIFRRHYSCKNLKPLIHQFVGPGEKLVLLSSDAMALFCWRKERYRLDGQTGVNCAVFRNEGTTQSSYLIAKADDLAWERWPKERLFTFVDKSKIRSPNPGYCFKMAGWKECGTTARGLIVLERQWEWQHA